MDNNNIEGLALATLTALGTGFIRGLAQDVEHEAYSQEQSDPHHSNESPAVHAAHAIGRALGTVVNGVSGST
jgi:hypothetical protein